MVWVTKISLLLCICFLDSFSCCKAHALTKKKKLFKMFSAWGMSSAKSPGIKAANAMGKPKTLQASWIITVTVTLNHQARLSELMDKLDLSRLRINYRGLNELINTIISFVICLKCYWFLIFFFFPNIGNFFSQNLQSFGNIFVSRIDTFIFFSLHDPSRIQKLSD